ncbi:MAG: PASTA domain-containing protein [Myxococcaceae bacterium]|nr:PASTA domain-containing protein [Myxococcaceae bacterium]
MSDGPLVIDRGVRAGTVVVLSILFSALTSTAVFFALRTATGAAVEVPAVTGMTVAQARELLDGKGLLLVLDAEREDAQVGQGSLIAQTPLPGSRVRSGEVHATVSKGWSRATVPETTNLAVDKATRLIGAAKLVVAGQDAEASAEVAAGTVIGTTPPAGAELAQGADVRLRVSSGPAAAEVPKVVGLNVKKAKEALEAAKFKVGATKYSFDEDKWPYTVLKQEPEGGAKVAPGATVDLVVNQGD